MDWFDGLVWNRIGWGSEFKKRRVAYINLWDRVTWDEKIDKKICWRERELQFESEPESNCVDL